MRDYDRQLSEHLQQFLTPQRQAKFREVLGNRTRKLAVVLIDLYQEHNASAILRSCEAFGVQDVYVVESEFKFSTKRDIAMGTDRWLTIHRFGGENGIDECYQRLKDQNYRIAATVLNEHSQSLETIEISSQQPLALVFGTEKLGLPEEAIDRADLAVHIPMYGFVESFNVSVAAALSLKELTQKLRQTENDWHLQPDERAKLWLDWTKKSIKNCAAIEKRFAEEYGSAVGRPIPDDK